MSPDRLAHEFVRAAANGQVDILSELLARGADPAQTDKGGLTPLAAAVLSGKKEAFYFLMQDPRVVATVNQPLTGWNDMTALSMSFVHGERYMTEVLVGAGANVNVSNSKGETPLFRAIKCGDMEAVRFLIESGADVNGVSDARGRTPLMEALEASEHVRRQMIPLLLDAGADVMARDNDGYTMGHLAAGFLFDPIDEIELYFRAGGDLNARCNKGRTVCDKVRDDSMMTKVRKLLAEKGQEPVFTKYPEPRFTGWEDFA